MSFIVTDKIDCLTQTIRYTGQVRWGKSGRLQQMVEIMAWDKHGSPAKFVHEWQDVPTEEDDQ